MTDTGGPSVIFPARGVGVQGSFRTVTTSKTSCCAPAGRSAASAPAAATTTSPRPPAAPQGLRTSAKDLAATAQLIPGGRGLVGTANEIIPDDGESPLRKSQVKPFRIGKTSVTNAEFEEFVTDTGYVTEAEQFGWSFVFWSQVPDTLGPTEGVVGVEWWRRVDGANWRDINGPGTAATAWHPDHPAVQLSWNDARAYAAWAGGRLPSEAEWEHAARGGLGDVRYPWGDEDPDDTGFLPCNIWQGRFPDVNNGVDGYLATAPAQSFEANGYGLFNMVGNIWEWTAEPFRIRSLKKQVKARMSGMKGYKLLKGGSFLCHSSYCHRYRIAARSGNSPDSTTTHQGFRMVWDV
ncbi:formylglycine-generating enzyme family protein [Marinovum sp. 2_MG-2023]|uniref:formylglycine-generating enzyme family protein n=1 Tax=unclassified Marinovum TaxID=2647166 RepID=UPI0026E24232|nr:MULTISPECIES: formylglycine-generating enzyme family protein [unclassified Marinovum]MDO6729948.1 formylglycine-generating enzyme family protein [Marinovum sp. 2_MG-2023]MDO6779762.1 formylglycine-generating enzyme family protein [Marinovum sp. 1_MG-2023]